MATPGQGRIERRLAAILAADVAGYSRLTEAGELRAARDAPRASDGCRFDDGRPCWSADRRRPAGVQGISRQ
jgi:hypothetical protein